VEHIGTNAILLGFSPFQNLSIVTLKFIMQVVLACISSNWFGILKTVGVAIL
jgi:hypothetical protein